MNIKAIWKEMQSIRFEFIAEYESGRVDLTIKPFLWGCWVEKHTHAWGVKARFGPFIFDIVYMR